MITKVCNVCKQEKIIDSFYKRGDGRKNQCKQCELIKSSLNYYKKAEEKRKSARRAYTKKKSENKCFICKEYSTTRYCEKCSKPVYERSKNRYKKRKEDGQCVNCSRFKIDKAYNLCEVCRERTGIYCRNRYKATRQKVIDFYGSNCRCCGETEICFLAIDHINGGGNKHRKEVGIGFNFYMWLINNNFPEGFQVLCHNCNYAKYSLGICPHQLKKQYS